MKIIKTIIKLIIKLIKAIISFIIAHPIAALIIAVISAIIIAIFIWTSNQGEDSTENDPNVGIMISIGGVFSRLKNVAEVNNFIDSFSNDIVPTNLKQTLKNNAQNIINKQDATNYSAEFIIVLAIVESENGKNDFAISNFLDRITVDNIEMLDVFLDEYLDTPETSEEFANKILETFLKSSYEQTIEGNDAETQTGITPTGTPTGTTQTGTLGTGEISESGDGYNTKFKNTKTDRTYINYKQRNNITDNTSFANNIFYQDDDSGKGELTIHTAGCGLTSAAIILSGYAGEEINPYTIVKEIANNGQYFTQNNEWDLLAGLTADYWNTIYGVKLSATAGTYNKTDFNAHLSDGNPLIIQVLKEKGSSLTDSQHWMAILDINVSENKVYVSNPSKKEESRFHWLDEYR